MFVKVNDVKLYYEVTGQGRPFILVHGNGEDHTIFDKLTAQLAPHYTVYALDSRSHGKSDRVPVLRYSEMADDVAAFIQALGLKKPLYYGFSDGGIIGLILAGRYQGLLEKLVVSGANTTPEAVKPWVRRAMKLMNRLRPDPLLELMITQPHITPAQLKRIDVPTLVLAGEKDLISEEHTRAIAAAIPGARLLILPGETHGSYVVHSDKLYAAMQSFIEDPTPRIFE